ncbi:MAG: hypothetical protein Q8930_13115 [Bacillota bacterium]|nr:hypothetical protein [Bacillota bacterium]
MKRNLKTVIVFIILSALLAVLSGCQKIDEIQLKMGLKNNDFEYIKDNKADKIVIQNTRDKGFKFTVTDKRTIKEMYDILSSAKKVDKKSSLEPDYVFEIYEGSTVHRFSYITGMDKNDYGNLYGDDSIYIVSKRIDYDIIKNLWNYRAPRDFKSTYYGSIIEFLKDYGADITKNSKNVGIDLSQDVEAAKYMLSTEIEDFNSELADTISTAKLVNNDRDKYDVLVTIKTQGYKTTVYKAIITVNDKKDNSETKYYVNNVYENNEWTIEVTKDKPDKF